MYINTTSQFRAKIHLKKLFKNNENIPIHHTAIFLIINCERLT